MESALAGGWGGVLGLKFRMTFVVAFHTSDQEAPGNYDRATQSDDVPGSLFPLVPPAGSSQENRLVWWDVWMAGEGDCGVWGRILGLGDCWAVW